MSTAAPSPADRRRLAAEARAAAAKATANTATAAAIDAQSQQRRAELLRDFLLATDGRHFWTREFHEHNAALMHDVLAERWVRVLAWIRRYSWGMDSLYVIAPSGQPKHQVDCARELGMDKQAVSASIGYLQRRGYLEDQPKMLVPILAPVLRVPEREAPRADWQEFFEDWKVAHASDIAEMEVARARYLNFRKVMIAAFKKFRTERTKGAATLLLNARSLPEGEAGSPASPVIEETPFEESVASHRRKNRANPVSQEAGTHAKAQSFLFTEIQRMQASYPHSTFSQIPIDPKNPDHHNLIELILKALGGYDEEYLVGYVVWVAANFRGLGTDQKGISRQRAPGTSSGPKGLGLLVNWANDYARVSGGQKG